MIQFDYNPVRLQGGPKKTVINGGYNATCEDYRPNPWTPRTHGKMKVLNPQYMGEITPKN